MKLLAAVGKLLIEVLVAAAKPSIGLLYSAG
jgi:hypothetical protein